jgi:FtsZ-binding cell division protein ZapB
MDANELAVYLEDITDSEESAYRQAATMLRQQQAEIEALKNGFNTAWVGTNNSEMAEVRAMANRCILKIQELEFEREGFENLVEMLESEKEALKDEMAGWKESYENCHRTCNGYGMN